MSGVAQRRWETECAEVSWFVFNALVLFSPSNDYGEGQPRGDDDVGARFLNARRRGVPADDDEGRLFGVGLLSIVL